MGVRGHLFVVRGHLDSVDHDAALIGLDEDCWVDPRDRFLFPDGPPPRPRSWPEGWGRAPGRPVWMVQSGNGTAEEALTRLRRVISAVAVMRLPESSPRSTALLAMPVLPVPVPGSGAGTALAPHAWLHRLLATLHAEASAHGVDIVLVAQDPGEYAAVQWIRRFWTHELPDALEETATELGLRAARGELAVFVGSLAVSPDGDAALGAAMRETAAELPFTGADEVAGLSEAEVHRLLELHDGDAVRKLLIDRAAQHERPSLVHALVAGTGSREFITTAQDCHLERSLAETYDDAPAVLPWSRDTAADAWVAKSRGDLEHPRDLTWSAPEAEHPVSSLLRGLTLTRHLLLVGARLDEPELGRALSHTSASATHVAPALPGRGAASSLWGERLRTVTFGGADPGTDQRTALLLLDRIGVHATRTAQWLLDDRFRGLLAPRDQVLADQVRALLALLPADTTTWTPLLQAAEDHGWLGRP